MLVTPRHVSKYFHVNTFWSRASVFSVYNLEGFAKCLLFILNWSKILFSCKTAYDEVKENGKRKGKQTKQ